MESSTPEGQRPKDPKLGTILFGLLCLGVVVFGTFVILGKYLNNFGPGAAITVGAFLLAFAAALVIWVLRKKPKDDGES